MEGNSYFYFVMLPIYVFPFAAVMYKGNRQESFSKI